MPRNGCRTPEAPPQWAQQEKLVMLWTCPWHTTPHASCTTMRFSSLSGKSFGAAGPTHTPQDQRATTLAAPAPTVRHSPCSGCLAPSSCQSRLGLCSAPCSLGLRREQAFSFPLPGPSPAFPRFASFSGLIFPRIFRVYFLSSLLTIVAPAPAKGLPLHQLPPPRYRPAGD